MWFSTESQISEEYDKSEHEIWWKAALNGFYAKIFKEELHGIGLCSLKTETEAIF